MTNWRDSCPSCGSGPLVVACICTFDCNLLIDKGYALFPLEDLGVDETVTCVSCSWVGIVRDLMEEAARVP